MTLLAAGRSAGRTAALAGAWIGVATAGAVVGFAAERYVMGRSFRGEDPYAGEPFGSLRGDPHQVITDDGVSLHVEVDEPAAAADSSGEAADSSGEAAGLTVVFCHGFALTQDAWYFQRRDLRGTARLVFWDQRGHGRSGALGEDQNVTIERLGADLGQVIDQVAPAGPVILVGHSMGGMTVMALARSRPELFGTRVVGTALIATSHTKLDVGSLGLPGYLGRLASRAAPGTVSMLARRHELVERGRRMSTDLGYVLTRRYAFSSGGSPALVEFTAAMNAAVPMGVIARFYSLFGDLDGSDTLPVLGRVPGLVIAAENDLLTPVGNGRQLAAELPDAEYTEMAEAGHMVLLEQHDLVSERIRDLLDGVRREGSWPARPRSQPRVPDGPGRIRRRAASASLLTPPEGRQ